MTDGQKRQLLEKMISALELPESAYERARDRYNDLGEWLGRENSTCKDFDPHVFPQGSFRLGTAIYPLFEDEAYDLDLACKLRQGIKKKSNTQESLKVLVGDELESYRKARGIASPLEAKHRCWRLEYQDHINFHMDIVPCIPADDARKGLLLESLRKSWQDNVLAETVAHLTVAITDDRHPRYRTVCEDWRISNPEGYAAWFESRMREIRLNFLEKAQIDELPTYRRKTALQRSIQLLKRHRDVMFKDDSEVKPISIIITTLAARAYEGETDILTGMFGILDRMGNFVNGSAPRVPNPVDPEEDFADRWSMQRYKHLNLEKNFWEWLRQARSDFDLLTRTDDANFITEQAEERFRVKMNVSDLRKSLGLAQGVSIVVPKSHAIESEPPKPWGKCKS